MKRSFLLILSMFFGFAAISQDYRTLPNYVDSIRLGLKYYDEGKYSEALQKYQTVPENDTIYITSVVEQMLAYYRMKEYDKGIELGDKIYRDWSNILPPEFYLNYGVCLDMKGHYEKTIEIYEQALKKYPVSHTIGYNKGIAYELNKEYNKAFEQYKIVADLNPFYPKVHYRLGMFAIAEKKPTMAFLALSTYLLLDPNSNESNMVLNTLNEIASSNSIEKVEPNGTNLSLTEDFSKIDLMIENYDALHKKYKIESEISYPALKQSHLIFTKLSELDESDEFWYRVYIPFYKYIIKNELFEDYSYYISQSSQSEKHQKILKKKAENIKSFSKKAKTLLDDFHRTFYLDKRYNTVYRGYGGYAISSLCNLSENGEYLVNEYRDFFTSGAIKSEGSYDNEGKKSGIWKLYNENGYLIETSSLEKDIYTDTVFGFSDYGIREYSYPVTNNRIHGEIMIFDNSGALIKKMNIEHGLAQGPVKEYYATGSLSYDYSMKDDLANGIYKSYFYDGKLYEKYNYVNGKREGTDTSYYRNGKIYKIETSYDGKLNGESILFWDNGKIQLICSYKDDALTGNYENYTYDGKLIFKAQYNDSGELDGIYKEYYNSGKVMNELIYKDNGLISYKHFNEMGEVFDQDEKTDEYINYRGYYKNGNIKMKGKYTEEGQQGTWEYYDSYGNLESRMNFKDGTKDGDIQYYYPNKYMYQKEFVTKGKVTGHTELYNPFKQKYFDAYLIDDIGNGEMKTYYPDGTLKDRSFYINDKLHGYSYEYGPGGNISLKTYYEDGILKKIYNYGYSGVIVDTIIIDSELNEITLHYEDGSVQSKYNFVNNNIHGNYFSYYPDGKIHVEANYNNSDLDGVYKEFYPDGTLAQVSNYLGNMLTGESRSYYRNGKLYFKAFYDHNELNGNYHYYFDSGKVENEGNFKNGKREDKFIYYSPEGEINHYRYYSEDAISYFEFFTKDGLKKLDFFKTGQVKLYFKNGKLARDFMFKDTWYDGEFKEYYYTGELYEKVDFKNNQVHGKNIIYFKNGNKKKETDFHNGSKHGFVIEYYDNGNIKRRMEYKNDLLDGYFEEYDRSGDLILKHLYWKATLIKIIK